MNDTSSQFSDQPLPTGAPSTQFSEQPIASPPASLDAGTLPDVSRRRPRLWPGVLILAVQWAAVLGVGWLFPATPYQFYAMFMGPLVGAVLILVWWLAFSRLRWIDRLVIPAVLIALGATVYFVGHPSIGLFGIFLYGLPMAMTAWVGWLVLSFPLHWPIRRAGLLAALLLTCGYYTLIRMDGVWGGMTSTMSWRWTPTSEEKFLTDRAGGPQPNVQPANSAALVLQPGDWPGFRGPNRDNRIVGVKIATDWDKHPPKLLWRHKVGPGWGSFAVIGKHAFTQEQWGDKEAVICYDGSTGKIIWSHEDPARFTEVVAGPGPRATPTFHEGKLYTMGAAGKLNCLDAASGRVLWSQDILKSSSGKVPVWGFSASPLVLQGIVMVYGGDDGKSVVAYDAQSGKFAWAAGDSKLSYVSAQRAVIDGVEQALLATDAGVAAFQPKDGKILWNHEWKFEGPRCIQVGDLGKGDLLIGTGFGTGTRRLHVRRDNNSSWTPETVWTSTKFSPYFNDFVIHRDHLFGFNTEIFTCVNLDKGKVKWKERGYGCGQVLLLADQDLLLIVSEKGEAALVEANPAEHKELARFQAIEGKTWNHPVLAHGRLFVRNGEEAACYEVTPVR